ncbi:MAG: cell division protein FtsZ [Armatimonadetes bacterium]|nr:cell division protein FtsZ [Armatimonadota bacterium]
MSGLEKLDLFLSLAERRQGADEPPASGTRPSAGAGSEATTVHAARPEPTAQHKAAPAEGPQTDEWDAPFGTSERSLESFLPSAGIKVVGVGGAGCNAVTRMVQGGLQGVEFLAVNTDSQALFLCDADQRLHIGSHTTRGLGAGADPEMGKTAVEENRDDIRALLEGADMVFITAGMGGGTGTGASPVVAEVAQEVGALTVGIVTKPFSFEGSRRRRAAEEGILAIRDKVDALITISNDRLLCVTDKKTTMVDAFRLADEVLRAAVQGISDIITVRGRINVDFADVQTVLQKSGSALIGIGKGRGEKRAVDAARAAISSPLLENSFQGARGILFNVTGGASLSLHEVDEAARVIASAAHAEANIIYGVVVEENRGDKPEDEITITVVASGFLPATDSGEVPVISSDLVPEPLRTEVPMVRPFAQAQAAQNKYEVPGFLRNRR